MFTKSAAPFFTLHGGESAGGGAEIICDCERGVTHLHFSPLRQMFTRIAGQKLRGVASKNLWGGVLCPCVLIKVMCTQLLVCLIYNLIFFLKVRLCKDSFIEQIF